MSNIAIAGNVGTDLVLRFSKAGNAFVTIPVAVTRGRDETKETDWYDVKCFGELAERMCEETIKGQRVHLHSAEGKTRLGQRGRGINATHRSATWRLSRGRRHRATGRPLRQGRTD